AHLSPTPATRPTFPRNHPAPPSIYPLSLHDALPISRRWPSGLKATARTTAVWPWRARTSCPVAASQSRTVRSQEALARRRPPGRSEEHTSELQSLTNLVCRLLLEKKKYPRSPL